LFGIIAMLAIEPVLVLYHRRTCAREAMRRTEMRGFMKDTGHRSRRVLLMLAFVASLVAMGWFYLYPDSSRQEPTAREPLEHAAISSTVPGQRPRVASRDGSASSLELRPDRPAPSAVRLPPAMQSVLDDNPDLAQYYRLEQKVLPTSDERNALRGMLSDPEMIQTVKEDLLATETTYSKEAEAKRMVAAEFLGDAATWADNPAMSTVMEAIEGVILTENISSEVSEELARSLAGDKTELYTQLLHRSPDRAELIADLARGKSVEPLLTYAKDSYNREMAAMKADESH
jgi:hypothetical protein